MSKLIFDQKLLDKLAKKLGKDPQYIREQIAKRAENNRVTSQAYFLHWLSLEKISASKYRRFLPNPVQEESRSLSSRQGAASASLSTPVHQKVRNVQRVLSIKTLKISPQPPLLLASSITDAKKENAEIYQALFILENSVRAFVIRVMEKNIGKLWWSKVDKIRDNVKYLQKKEKNNPWHGSRGQSEIVFTNFSDLSKIVKDNISFFAPLFSGMPGGATWLTQKLDENYFTRNNIAHSAPLRSRDRTRLMIAFNDWTSQLSILQRRI